MRDDITSNPSDEYRSPVINDEELSKTIMEKLLLSNLNNQKQSYIKSNSNIPEGLGLQKRPQSSNPMSLMKKPTLSIKGGNRDRRSLVVSPTNSSIFSPTEKPQPKS